MSEYHPPLRPTPPRAWEVVKPRAVTPFDGRAALPSANALVFPLTPALLREHVRASLDEDQAFNDISTVATVVSTRHARGTIVARQDGVVAGLALCAEAFRQLDAGVTMQLHVDDGDRVAKGVPVMQVSGRARALLSAERVALNYLQHLSGIATLTASFVALVQGTGARIVDTRKTTPGWRALEKYAVRAGGGVNHRMDLGSGVLIKDNHLAALGGDIGDAVARARALAPGTPIQVECDTLAQVDQALVAHADWVLLDNMSVPMLREAVTKCRGRAVTEASGGVRLDVVRAIAETGVDRISIGALTHSAPALDLSLDFADA